MNCCAGSTSRIYVWRREHVRRQVRRVGVEHDQLGERVVLELGAEVQARGARQVVETVAVLQRFELVLEHEVEGRTQQAAERHLLLGEAADPEVDVVDAGRGDVIEGPNHCIMACQVGVIAGAVEEVEAVRFVGDEGPLFRRPAALMTAAAAQDERRGYGPLFIERVDVGRHQR